jgi:hypothetical protein
MRDAVSLVAIPLVGIGVALAAGTSAARAQTVETVMTPAPGTMVVEQAPLVPPSGVLLPSPAVAVTAPVQTVETVRTVQTTEPRSARHVVHPRVVNRVTTTTRTTVRQGVVATAPAYAAAPAYEDFRRGPRLYDMVTTPAPLAAPPAPILDTTTVAAPAPMPTYRYVYQPDRILVIDPYSNIAVQAIPR